MAYAATAAVTTAATTAVTANVSENIAGSQKSAAEEAARTQHKLFEVSQQRFEQAILPQVPEPEVIKTQAKQEALKRRQRLSKTILTSPMGLINEPAVFRKTLLGQ